MIDFFLGLHVATQVALVLCLPIFAVIAVNFLAIALASICFICSTAVTLMIVVSEWWEGRKQ